MELNDENHKPPAKTETIPIVDILRRDLMRKHQSDKKARGMKSTLETTFES